MVPSRSSAVAILLEALMVTAAAAAFGLAANQLSPRGLKLAHDYFPPIAKPAHPAPVVVPAATTNTPSTNPVLTAKTNTSSSTNLTLTAEEMDRRIQQNGLQPIDRARAEHLFYDPRYAQGQVVFIDARDEDRYAEAHISGAYMLDRYHPDKELVAVRDACMEADLVVVYCNGGDCDDADYTAILLRDAGVPIHKLLVYGGGFEDWSAARLPLEQGARNSGLAPAQTK